MPEAASKRPKAKPAKGRRQSSNMPDLYWRAAATWGSVLERRLTHDLLQALDSTSGSVLNNSPEGVFEDGTRCFEIKIQLRDPQVAAALSVLYAANQVRIWGVNLAYNTGRRLLGREASFDRDLPSDDRE